MYSGLSFFLNLLLSRHVWGSKRIIPAIWKKKLNTYWRGRSTADLRQDARSRACLRTCVLLLLFFLLKLCKLFFPSVCQSVPRCIEVLLCQTAPQWHRDLAGWMDPPQTCKSGRCAFQDHLERNEKKFAIASNHWIQLFLKKHYETFFEPVCKPLERVLSKYVQLDQTGFVVKREFIRKCSENNKHHWEFLGSCLWIYEFML